MTRAPADPGAVPTTLDDVADLLRSLENAQGDMPLTEDLFPALGSALAAAGSTQLDITGANVSAPTGAVTVDGQVVMYGHTPSTVHLEVTKPGAALAAKLTFSTPAGWGLKDGFPDLPSSYKHITGQAELIGQGPSILYDLSLASATLTTSSDAATIAFDGALADAKAFTFIASALAFPAHPRLTGTIQLRSGQPAAVDLSSQGGTPTLEIGSLLSLGRAGVRAHTVDRDERTDSPLSRLDLVATLELVTTAEAGETQPVPVRLSAPFYELSDSLELTADFSHAALTIGRGVYAFAELLHLDVETFSLPPPLDLLGEFGLLELTCVVSIATPGVDRVVITVGPGVPWPIATGIEVDDLTIGWAVSYPFNGDARAMSASISGTLTLGTIEPQLKFDVLALASSSPALGTGLPAQVDDSFTISGHLSHPITLEELATTINGAPVHGLPTLTVLSAGFSGDTDGNFAVLVALGNWHLADIGSVSIDVYEVSAAISRQSGALTGQFITAFGVGNVRLNLSADMTLSSDMSAEARDGDGWVFIGGTAPGTDIPIGELLTELASYGIDPSQVPEPIRTLDLTTLNLTYDTAQKTFTFNVTARLTVVQTPVEVSIAIVVQPTPQAPQTDPPATVAGSKGYSATFTGTVEFNKVKFDLVFDVTGTGTDVLVADFADPSGVTKTDLRGFVEEISTEKAQAIPPGTVVQLDEVKFVYLKQQDSQWAFGIKLGAQINLNELPVVGSTLPAGETLSIEALQLLYSSADIGSAQTAVINGVMPSQVSKLPDNVVAGIAFDADVRLGDRTEHLHAGVTPPAAGNPQLPPGPNRRASLASAAGDRPVPASSTDPVKWLDINKQFGIFSFQRVGLGYENNELTFALDASVALGPLAFSMEGLTVKTSLTKFNPGFDLRGLALAFDAPPISIAGALLRVDEIVDEQTLSSYYGELMVEVAQFSLQALGGWAPDADPASFFVYLSLDVPLGGPPFLFVTGLAGGFGINTSLTLPTINQVGSYPLLPKHAPKEKSSAAETIKDVIPALQRVFHPDAGEYWVAAGIAFTSFEMIDAQAVVSVEFGTELQIGVVGTCSMTFPTGDPAPVAYVEIDVVASFTPSTGRLSVDGKLSPASYLFGGFVKITGGFAFYAWFSQESENLGDFVVSLGGYHPAFVKPSNYPAVPRLELSFSLGGLRVLGQAYFALVPSGFMAGLRIRATFAAGPVQAWFDAGIDVLFMWAPFHYDARAWITLGCALDLGLFTISLQIGAELEIWGPAFGGRATVDLDVVSFTIGFGADRRPPRPIGWDTLEQNFLPQPDKSDEQSHPQVRAMSLAAAVDARSTAHEQAKAMSNPGTTNVIKANVTAGQRGTGPRGVDWILDPNAFRILTSSTVPANHLAWTTAAAGQPTELRNVPGDYAIAPATPRPTPESGPRGMALQLDVGAKPVSTAAVWEPTLHIGPMDQKNISSHFTVALRRHDENGQLTGFVVGVTVAPQLAPSNTALWGDAPDPKNADQRLLPATLTGLAITPLPRHPDAVSDVPMLDLIFGEGHETGFSYEALAPDTRYTVGATTGPEDLLTMTVLGAHTASTKNSGYQLSALTDQWIASQREAILGELSTLGFETPTASQVSVAKLADATLTDWPMTALIGAEA